MPFQAQNRRFMQESGIVFFVTVLLYTLTTAHNFCEAHDSITYINEIDIHWWFSNPHHLLFRWLGGQWVAAARLVGIGAESATIVQFMNSFFGGLCMAMFYLFLRRRWGLSVLAAAISTGLPAFSYGFWYYSTAIEVYIVPMFFLLVALYLLTRPTLKENTLYWVGLAHGLACLFHMVHGLWGVVLLAALVLHRKRSNGTPAIRPFIGFCKYVVVAAPTVILPYLYVIHQRYLNGKANSLGEVARWWEGYAREPQYWNGIGFATLAKAIIGSGRSIIGGHFAFASPHLDAIASKVLKNKWLMDQRYLVRDLSGTTANLLFLGCAVLGLCMVVFTVLRLRRGRAFWRNRPLAVTLILVWLAVYCTFFFFWEPMNVEFWIPQSVILWLLLVGLWTYPNTDDPVPIAEERILETATTAGDVAAATAGGSGFRVLPAPRIVLSTPRLVTLGAMVLLLFVVNFFGSQRLLMDRENDYYWVKTHALSQYAGRDDLVVLGREWIFQEYTNRYVSKNVLTMAEAYRFPKEGSTAQEDVDKSITDALAAGHRVVIACEAVQAEDEAVFTFGPGFAPFLDSCWEPFRSTWTEHATPLGPIYVIEPTTPVTQ